MRLTSRIAANRAGHGLPMKPWLSGAITLWLAACAEESESRAGTAVSVGETGKATAALQAQHSMERLRVSLSRSSNGMVVEHRTDGIKKVSLQQRFQSVSVMTADGRATCVDSAAVLDRLVGAQP